MKTEAESTMPMDTASVWAEEKPAPGAGKKSPGILPVIILTVVSLLAVVVGFLWACHSGLQTLQSAASQSADNSSGSKTGVSQVLDHAQGWMQHMTIGVVGVGVFLLVMIVLGAFWIRRGFVKTAEEALEAAELRAQKLLGQIADARVSEEESRKAQIDVQFRLAELTEARTVMQQELDQRRQMEKSLALQAQQLERSKDVLEMHVQARTQELQKLQRRNELILNSAGEGICGFDLQGRATFVNPAAAKLTAWPIDQMIGRTENEIFFPAVTKGAKEKPGLLKNEKGELLPEQLFYRKGGNTFAVEYVRTPIEENGKVVGSVVMFKDITERRQGEDRLAHKAEELARSNAELEQFAFVASHDLQEPLRKIQAFGDRLKIKCEAVQLEEGRDYLERMQNAAARMQTLINDLLAFSRIIRASQPFTMVDLAILTKEVLGDLETRIEKSGGHVEVGALPAIEADPLQMRQLLQNLIGNALKFQAPGASPKVKVDAQLVTRDQIREDAVFPNPPPTVRPDDKFCVLTVHDNGIGFDEQYLEKIFAVFQRLHGRSEYEGTGVGLAVCRRIADRHSGLITAQSKPGEGATFIVILPLRQHEAKKEGQ